MMSLPKREQAPPDGIPQDVWDAASEVVGAIDGLGYAKVYTDRIARAMMAVQLAERERCAAKADHYTTAKMVRRARELTSEQVSEIKIFAWLIAHDIRKGSQ